MTQPLWQKSDTQVDARIMRFLAGNDVVLDREFFLHDITASKAHVEGLANIGVVSGDERDGLLRELDALAADFSAGEFILDDRFEDGHSAIEARLTERLGDAGRRVHTGRSRNDQILVATRLWLKERLSTCAFSALRVTPCLCRAIRIFSVPSSRQPACGSPLSPKPSSTIRCVRVRRWS
jgi:argininosuccinate lyase